MSKNDTSSTSNETPTAINIVHGAMTIAAFGYGAVALGLLARDWKNHILEERAARKQK